MSHRAALAAPTQRSGGKAGKAADSPLANRSPLGSGAAARLLGTIEGRASGLPLRPGLEIGAPDDAYEREADRVADRVMRMPEAPLAPDDAPAPADRAGGDGAGPPRIRRLAAGPLGLAPSPAGGSAAGTPALVAPPQGGGRPLPPEQRAFFEPRFARDLSGIRIHTDAAAGAAARAINARAFAFRNHIAFAPGAFSPQTQAGRHLIAHEVAHVFQGDSHHPVIRRKVQDHDPADGEVAAVEAALAAEAPIEADSELGRQIDLLSDTVGSVLREIVEQDQGDKPILRDHLEPERHRRVAGAVRDLVSYTQELRNRPYLDVARAAKWVDKVIFTTRILISALDGVAKKRGKASKAASRYHSRLQQVLEHAQSLQSHERLRVGALFVEALDAAALEAGLRKVESDAQLMTVGMSDAEIDAEIFLLRGKQESETDPVKRKAIEATIEGLKSGKTGHLRGQDTPVLAVNDRLKTAELSGRERAAELVKKMSVLDLQRAAKTGEGRGRMGRLGMAFSETNPAQWGVQTLFSGAPTPLAGEAGAVVSGRMDEDKAIRKLSQAFALAGGPSEFICVPDKDLGHFRAERIAKGDGEQVVLRKSDLLKGVQAMGDPDCFEGSVWTLDPTDLVTLRVAGTGEAVRIPAFGLLHIKDKAFRGTVDDWLTLLEFGVGVVLATKAAGRAVDGGEILEDLPQGTRPKASGQRAADDVSNAGDVERISSGRADFLRDTRSEFHAGGGDIDRIIADLEKGEAGPFRAEGPPVRVPIESSKSLDRPQLPARGLEIGAGDTPSDLGLPPEQTLVAVTRTDIRGTKGTGRGNREIEHLDATQPIPDQLAGQFDFVMINNPRGYTPDIENIARSLRPGGRIIVQGRGRVPSIGRRKQRWNPDFQRLLDRDPPPGFRKTVDLPPTRRLEDRGNVLGGPFRRTTGDDIPAERVNGRIIYEKIE